MFANELVGENGMDTSLMLGYRSICSATLLFAYLKAKGTTFAATSLQMRHMLQYGVVCLFATDFLLVSSFDTPTAEAMGFLLQ